jgi:hypothetical protein
MGMAKLNVWLSESENPCKISDRTHFVSIFTCDGRLLEYAGRKYFLIKADHGHLEVDVPPGCYYLLGASKECENAYTDAAIVRVGCGETACVTLWLGTLSRCLRRLNAALRLPRTRERLGELVVPAQAAINSILSRLPIPVREFELAHLDETEKFVLRPAEPVKKEE